MAETPDDTVGGLAWRVAERAYAPYSGFRVGAVVVARSGATYAGCNVENASYPMGLCAERNALAAAVAAEGDALAVDRVVVVALGATGCAPCGACRQVLAELAPHAAIRYLRDGAFVERPMTELLPDGFTAGDLT